MSIGRKPKRRRRARNGLITSRSKRKGSPCQQDNDSQDGETEAYSGPSLPEDIWSHIHSLMPMRDAARAACVSRAFLRSWKFHPNLTFDDETFGLNKNTCEKDKKDRDFSNKVDHILKRHSGFGVKSLKLQIHSDYNVKDPNSLDSWLQIVITPGIEELTFSLPPEAKYNFPYTLLCIGSGESI